VIGLSDGKNIEIMSGNLAEGDQVIVAQYRGAEHSSASRSAPSAVQGASSSSGTTDTSTVGHPNGNALGPAAKTSNGGSGNGVQRAAPGAGSRGKGSVGAAHTENTRLGTRPNAAAPGADSQSAGPLPSKSGGDSSAIGQSP